MRTFRFVILGIGLTCLSGEATDLDEKIQNVQDEIEKEEKKAMNAELESQGYFRDNYAEFARELKESEESEEKADALKKELDHLLKQKEK